MHKMIKVFSVAFIAVIVLAFYFIQRYNDYSFNEVTDSLAIL